MKLAETLALTDGEGVSDADAEAVMLALALWLGEEVRVADGESVEVPLLLLDAVLVGVLVSVALADREDDGVGVCGDRGCGEREDRGGRGVRAEGEQDMFAGRDQESAAAARARPHTAAHCPSQPNSGQSSCTRRLQLARGEPCFSGQPRWLRQ